PVDRAHAEPDAASSWDADEYHFALAPALSSAVWQVSARERVTPFMAVVAAYSAVLSNWSGQRDVSIDLAIAGRAQPQLSHLIGYFANFCPLSIDIAPDATYADITH